MRYLAALLLLSSCATTGPKITFPDHSENSQAWGCLQDADRKNEWRCYDFARMFQAVERQRTAIDEERGEPPTQL